MRFRGPGELPSTRLIVPLLGCPVMGAALPPELQDLARPPLPRLATFFRVTLALSILPVAGMVVYAAATVVDAKCPEAQPQGRIWRTGCGDAWGEGQSFIARVVGAGFTVGTLVWIDAAGPRPDGERPRKHSRTLRWSLAVAALALALAAPLVGWPWWVGLIGLAVPLLPLVGQVLARAWAARKGKPETRES